MSCQGYAHGTILANPAPNAGFRSNDGNANPAHGFQFDLGEYAFRGQWIEIDTDLLHVDRVIPGLFAFVVTQNTVLLP